MSKKTILIYLISMFAAVNVFAETAAPASERSFWSQFGRDVLLYIPNRLADTADLFTVKFEAGYFSALKVEMSQMAAFGFDHGSRYFIGKGYNRQWGGGRQESGEFAMFCWQNANTQVDNTFGTFNNFLTERGFGSADHDLAPYREGLLDFWNIGVRVGAGLGCEFKLHLDELPDLILGFFCLNISGDDYK